MVLCEPGSNITNEPRARRCGFWVETLNSNTFAIPPIPPQKSARQVLQSTQRDSDSWDGPFSGKVNCSLSFTSTDGNAYLAVGCDEGVWIGRFETYQDSQTLRRVLYLKMVTQCAMLEEYGIFLVLADKTLLAYDIESLLPSSRREDQLHLIDRLGESNCVQFFSIGSLWGQTHVIYMTKQGSSRSFFHVLKPTVGKVKEEGPLSSQPRFTSPRWFLIFRSFSIPSEAYSAVFMQERIVIFCKKGVEIMDLPQFQSITMPLLKDTRPDLKELAKRCQSCRPMGLFRSKEEEYLICYDKFGLYVNRRGEPNPTRGTIEWEGTAEDVAWHPPYILIFNSRFIEVRHISAGKLCQIIRGEDIRCTSQWDRYSGSSVPWPLPRPGPWGEAAVQRTPVCGVMRRTEDGSESEEPTGPSTNVGQRVFQLVPTLPGEEILPPAEFEPLWYVRTGWTTLKPEYQTEYTLPAQTPPRTSFSVAVCVLM